MLNSDWYKPLEKYEDERTVGDVYFAMSNRKRSFVHAAMRFAMGELIPDCADSNEVWSTFTDNERLATLYLVNEAILHKELAFEMIEVWKLFREP